MNMIEEQARNIHDQISCILDSPIDLLDDPWVDSKFLAELRNNLMTLNEELHGDTERALAKELVTNWRESNPFQGTFINKGFSELLSGQIDHWRSCGILNAGVKKVAVVGGGALPQTQYFLHEKLGLPIYAIERDAESAELCRAVLDKIGTRDLFVINEDGAHHDYSGYELVVVATMVRDKNLIARQVRETAPVAAFSPRTPLRNHRLWRESVDVNELVLQGWLFCGSWEPTASSVASLVFRKDTKEKSPL